MPATPEPAASGDHTAHLAGGPVRARKKGTVRWRLAYVASMVGLAALLFLLVPDGGSLALLVIFAGLMIFHHLPGGHGHDHHAAARNLQSRTERLSGRRTEREP